MRAAPRSRSIARPTCRTRSSPARARSPRACAREARAAALVHKIPVSTLVVIHTPALEVLLLERADHPGFWQSVTGSQHEGEGLRQTAIREVAEETGLDATRYPLREWNVQNVYEIYAVWRHRYAPGVSHNTEHVFALEIPEPMPVMLSPREHLAFRWLP